MELTVRVAVLGSGPAGLQAALAVVRNGHEPVIFTRDPKSHVNDDMFLQRPLPTNHPVPDDHIMYERFGEKEVYAQRAYGSPAAECSWDSLALGMQPVWWLKDTYSFLYETLKSHILKVEINRAQMETVVRKFTYVISTIPIYSTCTKKHLHGFASRRVWLVRRREDSAHHQGLIYNGRTTGANWFRYSLLNGWATWEYGDKPDLVQLGREECDLFLGRKPTGNNCDCFPTVARVGRWAIWERGIMNHHAFEQATAFLSTVGLGGTDEEAPAAAGVSRGTDLH